VKSWIFRLVLFLVVALTVELGAFGALAILRMRHYLYEVPRPAGNLDYAARSKASDPVLGWPLRVGRDVPGGAYRDKTGARRLPAFPDPDANSSCVSLYGDSFVESVEMDHEHAAANLLASAIGCRVANFGQAAYGSDQAFLRYRLNPADQAGTVILGHMLENIRRNVNRNRDLLTRGRDYNLKPRFVLGSNGELVFVPLPKLTEEEYDRTIGLRPPLLRLEHESFQPGGGLVGPLARFPYLLSLFRNLEDYSLRARFRGNIPRYAEFYQPDHPTQALALTLEILKAFRAETALRAQRGVVLLLPTLESLTYRERAGAWIHQPLLERLDREGLAYMDFGPYVLAHRDRDLAAYFSPTGHYSELGDALLARMMADELTRKPRSGPR
jgi:hypothetical protein